MGTSIPQDFSGVERDECPGSAEKERSSFRGLCYSALLSFHRSQCTSIVPFVVALSSILLGTLANPVSKFATPCTPGAQFQLLNARALHARSLISATCTSSGAEETSGLLRKIEILSYSPVPRMSESWSSLQQYLRHLVFFNCLLSIVTNVETARDGDRSIVRPSSLRPRRNRRPLAVRRESRSGRSILDCATSGCVKYVGTVLPLCPLVPGRISGRSNRTSARTTSS